MADEDVTLVREGFALASLMGLDDKPHLTERSMGRMGEKERYPGVTRG